MIIYENYEYFYENYKYFYENYDYFSNKGLEIFI